MAPSPPNKRAHRLAGASESPGQPLWVRGASSLIGGVAFALRAGLDFAHPSMVALKVRALANRGGFQAFAHRLAWWAALCLVAIAGKDFLSISASNAAFSRAPYLLCAATLLCAFTVLRTRASHIRVGSLLLGSSAGALGIFAWLVQSA